MSARQAPRIFRTSRAFLVRSADAGEADVRLTLFTEEAGLVTLSAKSARRSRKRFGGGAIERYVLIDAGWTDAAGRMGTLTQAVVRKSYWEILADWDKVRHADYILEVAALLFPNPGPKPKAFAILLDGLEALLAGEPAAAVARKAEAAFLWTGGWGPNLSACRRCSDPSGPFRFDPSAGGLLCAKCAHGRGTALSLGAIKTWRAMQLRSPGTAGRLKVPEVILVELHNVMPKYLEWSIGLSPRSLGGGRTGQKP